MLQPGQDELALRRLIARVALAIDDRDADAYAACFAPTLEQWRENENDGWEPVNAAEYARKAVASVAGLDWTHHQVMNVDIAIAGDSATARSDIVVLAHLDGETVTLGGRYWLEFARTEAGWLVTRRRRTTRYVLGDPSLIARSQSVPRDER